MKSTRIVGAGLFLAVISALGLRAGPGSPKPDPELLSVLTSDVGHARSATRAQRAPRVGRDDGPADGPRPVSELQPGPAPPPAPTVRTAPASSRDRTQRRYRRRFVNRWPGPIPTPADWRPPDGPVRVALQAGHWRAHEAPDELSGLRDNGTRWRDTAEWQANLSIARAAATMLEEHGYEVDVLPAVVPPSYRAHLFISIHADGSGDPAASGYRVASPRLDTTGRAARIARILEERYGAATGLRRLPTVTRRMRNYYAFNFRRYEHALHPMTIAVILETGFLTSARDRSVILDAPERAARGIVDAVLSFEPTRLAETEGATALEVTEFAWGPEAPAAIAVPGVPAALGALGAP